MKKLVLKKLELTNFRGHKETTATFSDMTTITGDNGTGKSTIFEAFLWCLFGKDQFDQKGLRNHTYTERQDAGTCRFDRDRHNRNGRPYPCPFPHPSSELGSPAWTV